MKNFARFIISPGISALFFCAVFFNGHPLMAGESPSAVEPAQEAATYSNWVNLTLGGQILGGDQAQFKQANHTSSAIIGGIEDMHYEKTINKNAQLSIDGHAIIDNSDYKVKVEFSQRDIGYVRFGYTLFRTWYDDNGGYLPSISPAFPKGQFFSPDNNEMALDRGDAWIEFGLRVPDFPEITLRYDHQYRYGQKDSTSWGTGFLNPPSPIVNDLPTLAQRKVMPSFRDINETRDIFTLDATQTVFGNTDLELGMRYEHERNNDSLNTNSQGDRGYSDQTYLTQVDKLDLDLYSGHFSSVTRFNDNFWLTAAYAYSTINSDTGGSRLSGTTGFFPVYDPLHPVSGVIDLKGGSETGQHVINFNLMYVPVKNLTITPAVRAGIENTDSNVPYVATTMSVSTTGTNYAATSSRHLNEIEESLDIRYTGFDNIVVYLLGNWDERSGDLQQSQITDGNMNGMRTVEQNAGTTYLSQKYQAGINWYPFMRLNLALQYYYQTEQSDFDWKVPTRVNDGIPMAGTNLGVISSLGSNTSDVNMRVTWHPAGTLTLVTRYDMQYVNMDNTGIYGPEDSTAPDEYLSQIQSARITNTMFTESITWSPLAKLYLQGNASYVKSKTNTPANSIKLTDNGPSFDKPSVLNSKNNYYELSCDVGFVINDNTDLHAGYSYYRADDYQNNVTVGMPFGAGATENTFTASIVHRFTKYISMSLTYAYYTYRDETSGDNNNYTANLIYSGLQFKF